MNEFEMKVLHEGGREKWSTILQKDLNYTVDSGQTVVVSADEEVVESLKGQVIMRRGGENNAPGFK